MFIKSHALLAFGCALLTSTSVFAQAGGDVPKAGPKADPYARVTESDSGDVILEMCERVFKPTDGDGPRIHLISAIHIADQSFYASMQQVLESYDSVLFEGVKPAGLDAIDQELDDLSKADATQDRLELLLGIAAQFYDEHRRLPKGFDDLIEHADPRIGSLVGSIRTDGWAHPIIYSFFETIVDDPNEQSHSQHVTLTSLGSDSAIGGEGINADIVRTSKVYSSDDPHKPTPAGIQTQLANALHVAFQLDEMDMTGKGWINADIEINELQSRLAESGGDDSMILQMLEGSSFQAKVIGFMLKFVERSPMLSSMMKLAMMDMLAMIDTTDIMGQFDVISDVILHGRNDIVIQYLKAELQAHPSYDDIAVFYGAAHMPGIEEAILTELGYEFDSNTWAQAMAVNTKGTGLSQEQIEMMRNMIKSSFE